MPTYDHLLEYLKEKDSRTPISIVFELAETLAQCFDANVIGYFSGFESNNCTDHYKAMISDNDMQGFMTCVNGLSKKDKDLIVILHTPGGAVESTKRIVNYLRKIFKKKIITIVPRSAFSMGTYIACASDEIYMGPYSYLGPADPQINLNGSQVSVDAIKKEFDQAKQELLENPDLSVFWTPRLTMLAPGYLSQIDNICKHMKQDLMQVLSKYMFKDTGKSKNIIESIANTLTDHTKHSAHDKGISIDEATAMGLKIVDFSENNELEDLILSIYHLMSIIFNTHGTSKIIFNNKSKIYAY